MENKKYTAGGQYRNYKTGEEYVGFYFEKNKEFYGGIEELGTDYIHLMSYDISSEASKFRNLKSQFKKKLRSPNYFRPRPTTKDYDRTVIARYFIKNDHNKNVFEVDSKTYKYYNKKDSPLKNIYVAISLDWKIAGPQNDVVDTDNTTIATGVFETNKRTLERHAETIPELQLILNPLDLAKITL
tara:strand:+ start:27864 stop:28418 length:555 start_codon:yes stop_codon:yes gene_type:complete